MGSSEMIFNDYRDLKEAGFDHEDQEFKIMKERVY